MTAPQTGTERRQRLKNLREAALHRPVLARHLSNGFNGRWSRRQWVQASLFATLGMLVASIVPGFDVTPVQGLQGTRQSMALTLPPLPVSQSESTPGDSWQVVRVQPGQTLGALFQQMGVPATTMYRILEQPGARQALTRLRPGTELAFDLPLDGPLRAFRFDRDNDHRVELTIKPDAIVENVIKRPSETRTVVASGEISSSLYAAARKAGP